MEIYKNVNSLYGRLTPNFMMSGCLIVERRHFMTQLVYSASENFKSLNCKFNDSALTNVDRNVKRVPVIFNCCSKEIILNTNGRVLNLKRPHSCHKNHSLGVCALVVWAIYIISAHWEQNINEDFCSYLVHSSPNVGNILR